MTLEEFLAAAAAAKVHPEWSGERTSPANAALALGNRLRHPLPTQAMRPKGIGLRAGKGVLEKLLAGTPTWRDDRGSGAVVDAHFDDVHAEFRVDPEETRPYRVSWRVSALALRNAGGGRDAGPSDGLATAHEGRCGHALAIVGGAAGLAALTGFVAAMADVVATTLEGAGAGDVRRVLQVEAETSRDMARCVVVTRRTMGTNGDGDEVGSIFSGPLDGVALRKRGNVAAMHHALARTRPVVDDARRVATPFFEDLDRLVAQAAIPSPPESATLLAAFGLRQNRARVQAQRYLRSIGAPAGIVRGVAP